MRSRLIPVLIATLAAASIWPLHRAWRAWRTEAYREQCEQARRKREWHVGLAAAQEWTVWDPSNGSAWLYRAEAEAGAEDFEGAAQSLGRVPQDHPDLIPALLEKANLEWTYLNQPRRGLETCEQILQRNSRILEAHARIISFYAMTLQRPRMLAAIRRAIDAGAEPREAYTYLIIADHLSLTNGTEHNRRWLTSDPESQEFRIALAVYTTMQLEMEADASAKPAAAELDAEAQEHLYEFLDHNPHNPVLLSHLAERSAESGHADEVGRLLQAVAEEGADDHMLWVLRGWFHLQRGELDEADEALRQALQLHPLSPRAHHEYATLLRRRQSLEDAEQHARLAAEGRELRRELLHLPTAADLNTGLLERIGRYAADCGDQQVDKALQKRLHSVLIPQTMPAP